MAEAHGWRIAVLTFAVIILVVAIPLFRYGTALPAPEEETEERSTLPDGSSDLRRAMAKPTFWLLGVTFAMIGLTHGMVIPICCRCWPSRGSRWRRRCWPPR